MSFDLDISMTGDDLVARAGERLTHGGGAVLREEVTALGDDYVRVLKEHTPVGGGSGSDHKRLVDSYESEPQSGVNAASVHITNTAPHVSIILKGRKAVVPVRAKVLRWIDASGRVVFSMRSGPVKANPFDEDARREMQSAIDAFPAQAGGRVVRLWDGE